MYLQLNRPLKIFNSLWNSRVWKIPQTFFPFCRFFISKKKKENHVTLQHFLLMCSFIENCLKMMWLLLRLIVPQWNAMIFHKIKNSTMVLNFVIAGFMWKIAESSSMLGYEHWFLCSREDHRIFSSSIKAGIVQQLQNFSLFS